MGKGSVITKSQPGVIGAVIEQLVEHYEDKNLIIYGSSSHDLLDAILDVDGSGSGLDADKLDGHEATYFAPKINPIFLGTVTTPVLKVTTGAAAGNILVSDANGILSYLAAGATTEILVGGGAADPVWTTASGTGAPIRAGSPTFTGEVGVIGNINLPETINTNTGMIMKNSSRFIHNYYNSAASGYNTFIGKYSGNFTMSPAGGDPMFSSYNSALGYNTLLSLTTGYKNIAVGARTLENNTTGHANSMTGYGSGFSITTGYDNSVLGTNAFHNEQSGYSNVAVGTTTLYYQLGGYYNTSVGDKSGYNPVNDIAQYRIGSDSYMVFLGYGASKNNVSTLTNGIAIGSGAFVLQSNQVVLGNDNITTTLLKGNVGIDTISPQAKLHIYGVNVGFDIEDPTTPYRYRIQVVSARANNFEIADINTGVTRLAIDVSGNFGFGFTQPLSTVCINGGLHVGGESAAGDNNLLVDGTADITGTLTTTTIKITDSTTVGYFWKCTNADGSGQWTNITATQYYQGAWDANTNTPVLADGVGTTGYYYTCNVAGTVDLGSGNIVFAVGDQVMYNGAIWEKIPVSITVNLTGPITSVGNATSIAAQTGTGDVFAMETSPTFLGTVTLSSSTLIPDGGSLGQAAGPLLTFDDTNNYLEITGCTTGFGFVAPLAKVAIDGGLSVGIADDPGDDNLYVDGTIGVGTTASAKIHALETTEQLRLGYDAANYASFTVNATGDLTIAPTFDLILDPDSDIISLADGVAIQSYDFASEATGWRITNAGAADFRYIFSDEMHVKAFIADLEQALAGGQIIAKSVAKLVEDFVIPAAGGTNNLIVEEFAGFTGAVFADGDTIRLRQMTRDDNTTIDVADVWGTVVYSSRDGGVEPSTQTYVFTRSANPNAGTGAGTIDMGSLALDYGTTGNGFYEVTAVDGLNGANSPYAQVVTWETHPIEVTAGQTVRARMGNLAGLPWGVADEFGLFAGDGTGDANHYIRISSEVIEGHNLDIKLYDGAANTVFLDSSTPSFALGSTVPSAYGTGTGIWMGKDSGVYKFRVGDPTGNRITWDNSTLNIVGTVTATSGTIGGFTLGATTLYAGAGATRIQLDTTAGIHLGATAFAAAPFRVSLAGALTSTSGTIGGWTLAATTLTGGSVTLSNTGYISAGTGDDIAILSAADATYRLWLGDATAADAPFRVTKEGSLTAIGIAELGTNPVTDGTYNQNIAIIGGQIRENSRSDDSGKLYINMYGYNGSDTYYRYTRIGNGKGDVMIEVNGPLDIVGIEASALIIPRIDETVRGALTPINGMLIYNTDTGYMNMYVGGSWQKVAIG